MKLAFGAKVIFDGLSLELRSGRITAAVGANGSGKSTLLKLAGQFIRPDAGSIKAFENDRELDRAKFRKKIAALAPSMSLYARLTAEENLRFFVGLRGKTLETIEPIFNRVGLSIDDAKKFVGEYSTGMVQRLKFAIVLSSDADVWLLDEPGSNLDDAGREMILDEIKRGATEGKMILSATNDPNEAEIADEKIILG